MKLRPAFQAINSMFAELYSAAGNANGQQVINVGAKPNSTPPGDNMPTAGAKINANFTYLFNAVPIVGLPALQQVINLANSNGNIIGLGAPGRYAMLQINANFSVLYGIL